MTRLLLSGAGLWLAEPAVRVARPWLVRPDAVIRAAALLAVSVPAAW